MLRPVNDLAKIELDNDEFGFGDSKTTAESGVLTEIPKEFNFFGFWSFCFENSFMEAVELKKLHDFYKQYIGQRVYWTAMAERGNIIQTPDGKRFAFVKFTSLIASDDDKDSKAFNVHADGAGSFKA